MNEQDIARFRRIEAIFNGALEHPAGEQREAFLDSQTAPDLLEEVRQLIEDHERVVAAVPPAPEALPKFGPWQATRLLGRGGMGTVYLAERSDGAFRMAVAVKVVPLALASVDIEERFRRERQFLASLDHPKIARLLDGGVTAAGLPFLVMEFVDGLPIDRFCEAHHLDPRARIALMRQVLDALIYVHGKQVIHRDLKPSNILVDAAGNAKLLDFGTARLADAGGDHAITKTGVFAFTPECASPEQVQGKPLTFASDIYSAGILLYRLLTGRPPYSFTDFTPSSVAEKITRAAPEPSGLDRPLDAILSTALGKDPEQRYASAADMDADLARYLGGQPVRARRPRKLLNLAILAAAAVLCVTAGWAILHRTTPAQPPSVAVLPFATLSSDPDGRYLSTGFIDGVTDTLSRSKALRVIAPASSAEFAGKKMDVRQAGQYLHVSSLLEGTIARSGDRVKITAKLERVPDGALLWSETYERPQSALLAVQSDVAAKVARSLKVPADAGPPSHVPNPAAHDDVMKARYEMQALTSANLDQAEKDYQHAIDLDPQYAAAYLGLAMARYDEYAARGSVYQTDEERRDAISLTRKAIDLDPDLASAHAWLATMEMQFDWNWTESERELQLATSGAPNATAENGYAFWMLFHRRFAEAEEHIQRVQDIDPFSTPSMSNLALMRNMEGRYQEARDISSELAGLYPRMIAPKLMSGLTYLEQGNTSQAWVEIRKLPAVPYGEVSEAMLDAESGQRSKALGLIHKFEEKYPNPGIAIQWIALVYAFMGDEPNTVKWLQRSADRHEWQVLNIAVHPLYASMRNAPDFRALEKRLGLLP